MPIKLTPRSHDPLAHGWDWQVSDRKALAKLIALVALGQARHVNRIFAAATVASPLSVGGWDAAIKLVTVEKGAEPWHRDGWLFQVISWVAALKAAPMAPTSTPHLIHAQKGFDGVQLELDAAGGISAVVIFEDKATDNPRDTVRDDVWPEFTRFEQGEYANVLVAEVTGLLEKLPGIDVDEVIRRVIWKDARSFRVSITVGDTHSTVSGYRRLFKDYDATVLGPVKRRRAETFYVADLRPWMEGLALEVVAHINALRTTHV